MISLGGYWVEGTNGRQGYLKALDYSSALKAPDPAWALQTLTSAYNFERAILDQCKANRLDRVVTAIADGAYDVPDAGPLSRVQYIIFERAEGTSRSQMDSSKRFDLAWSLRALHHTATGLQQLHNRGIAHQDIKPSNILTFKAAGAKIADLGRATSQSDTAPHEELSIAGDYTYAPPELLYKQIDSDWSRRRLGCDAYLLGSMILFFLTGVGTTTYLMNRVDPNHHWRVWGGSYGEVLPYIRNAFTELKQEVELQIPGVLKPELSQIIYQLCEPDPVLRGHPNNLRGPGNQYALERYVSVLDLLARRAEIHFKSLLNDDRKS